MGKSMKSMKSGGGKAMTKGDIYAALESSSKVSKKECKAVVDCLEGVVTSAVKSGGKVVLPGICRIVLKHKKATKATKRVMFGKTMTVKAKPARKVVKIFAVKSLKEEF